MFQVAVDSGSPDAELGSDLGDGPAGLAVVADLSGEFGPSWSEFGFESSAAAAGSRPLASQSARCLLQLESAPPDRATCSNIGNN